MKYLWLGEQKSTTSKGAGAERVDEIETVVLSPGKLCGGWCWNQGPDATGWAQLGKDTLLHRRAQKWRAEPGLGREVSTIGEESQVLLKGSHEA